MSLSLNPKHLKLYREILRLLVKHGRGELVKDAPLFDDTLEGAPTPPVPAEARELLSMVKIAVRRACMRNDDARQIFLGPDRNACLSESYAKAVARINAKRKVDVEAVAARHSGQADIATTAQ